MKNNFRVSSPCILFAVLFLAFMVMPVDYAVAQSSTTYSPNATDPGNLGNLGTVLNKVLGFFTSGYMKAILTIALGGLGVGLIMNRGEPGMVKKFIPWVFACALLLSLSSITEMVFK